jgi:hypothetical protein
MTSSNSSILFGHVGTAWLIVELSATTPNIVDRSFIIKKYIKNKEKSKNE